MDPMQESDEDIARAARMLNRIGPDAMLRYLLEESERYYLAEEDDGRKLPHLKRACRIAHAALADKQHDDTMRKK